MPILALASAALVLLPAITHSGPLIAPKPMFWSKLFLMLTTWSEVARICWDWLTTIVINSKPNTKWWATDQIKFKLDHLLDPIEWWQLDQNSYWLRLGWPLWCSILNLLKPSIRGLANHNTQWATDCTQDTLSEHGQDWPGLAGLIRIGQFLLNWQIYRWQIWQRMP